MTAHQLRAFACDSAEKMMGDKELNWGDGVGRPTRTREMLTDVFGEWVPGATALDADQWVRHMRLPGTYMDQAAMAILAEAFRVEWAIWCIDSDGDVTCQVTVKPAHGTTPRATLGLAIWPNRHICAVLRAGDTEAPGVAGLTLEAADGPRGPDDPPARREYHKELAPSPSQLIMLLEESESLAKEVAVACLSPIHI